MSVDLTAQTRQYARPLLFTERWRVCDIEQQLHARIAALYMLPARTAGAAETKRQLTLKDRELPINHHRGPQIVRLSQLIHDIRLKAHF